ncbi:Butyrophilin subfamily 1 member A1 [Camelus dromedarius]|uniref:Butyrophilin subfamily 1 member A1 n=1 Tax=Camelus dromedarius TaxID=9838 RepID=A0A5N4CQJ0_CAMDR|nr:Butyrophilin subfamily 1 member A1 [Camelus dromedarius]
MAGFPNSCLLGSLLIFILLQLPQLDSAPFEVIGPPEPIVVVVGEDAELPCHLSPNASAERMELRWFRKKLSPAVFVRREAREQAGEQMAEYRGRATLVDHDITAGRVAVRIHEVKASDDGEYRCFFRQDENYEEAVVLLKVAALGSDPHISMEVQESGEIRLECTSVGWYPDPQVQWRTPKGEVFPSMSESRKPDEESLFTVAASVIIRDPSMKNVSCCIRNLLLNQEKEVEISIPEKLLEELKWKKATLHAVDVTLDPDTAHPHLFLYDDSKSVRLEDSRQKLPETPDRFDSWPCVLGREVFTSGRHYWEVEVGDRTDWAIGVCRENVMKKGFDPMTPENGFWAVELYGNGYWALTPLRTPLPLAGPPRQVGIFLDYESGDISFYNMTDGSHIYTFSNASFSGPLRPFFCLWSCGKKPLTICPITVELEGVTVVADAKDLSKEIPLSPMAGDSASGETGTLRSKLIPPQPSQGVS